MADHRSKQRAEDLLQIREAQAVAAAAAFRGAIEESEAAGTKLSQCKLGHDEALSGWLDVLNSTCPDPSFAALRGQWLVSQQAQVQAEELNVSIASQRQNRARGEYSGALALSAAAKKIGAQIRTSMARKQEESHSSSLSDAWLWRRG